MADRKVEQRYPQGEQFPRHNRTREQELIDQITQMAYEIEELRHQPLSSDEFEYLRTYTPQPMDVIKDNRLDRYKKALEEIGRGAGKYGKIARDALDDLVPATIPDTFGPED